MSATSLRLTNKKCFKTLGSLNRLWMRLSTLLECFLSTSSPQSYWWEHLISKTDNPLNESLIMNVRHAPFQLDLQTVRQVSLGTLVESSSFGMSCCSATLIHEVMKSYQQMARVSFSNWQVFVMLCDRCTRYIMAHFHRRVCFGPARLSPVVKMLFDHAQLAACTAYPYGRAGFKPDGDSRGSYVSIVTS